MKTIVLIIAIVLLGAVITACSNTGAKGNSVTDMPDVTVFKSASCGCCSNYVNYLEKQGFNVLVTEMQDLSGMKAEAGIPAEMQSCHTSKVGDYVVEGHMPIEAIQKLMDEQPDIKGIALPGMPAASPGMPGTKMGAFLIMTLDGQLFMEI
jgi:hypothetical protein